MAGPIGLLFREFAVVVSLSILVSALVSLTIVPMLCSRFLPKPGDHPKEYAITKQFDRLFDWTLKTYVHYLKLCHREIQSDPIFEKSQVLPLVQDHWILVTALRWSKQSKEQIKVLLKGLTRMNRHQDGERAERSWIAAGWVWATSEIGYSAWADITSLDGLINRKLQSLQMN